MALPPEVWALGLTFQDAFPTAVVYVIRRHVAKPFATPLAVMLGNEPHNRGLHGFSTRSGSPAPCTSTDTAPVSPATAVDTAGQGGLENRSITRLSRQPEGRLPRLPAVPAASKFQPQVMTATVITVFARICAEMGKRISKPVHSTALAPLRSCGGGILGDGGISFHQIVAGPVSA